TFILCDEAVYEDIEFKLFFNFRNSIVDDTVSFSFNNFTNPSGINFNEFDGEKNIYKKFDKFYFDDNFFLQKINKSLKDRLESYGIEPFTVDNFNDNILIFEIVFY